MSIHQFSMNTYWNEVAKNFKPLMQFNGNTYEEWQEWSSKGYQKLIELLGDLPEKVDPKPDVEYSVENGELIRERVVFDCDQYMSVPCTILKPKNMKSDGSNPAILCSHGHLKYTKETLTGVRSTYDHINDIEEGNSNYAEQMARAGYLTITPDLRGFGERRDKNPIPGKDPCNINFIKGVIMGYYLLTLNIFDMMRCVDYLETRPEVDKKRIGMMGCSLGGTMTTFTTAVDKRIKCADIICYLNPWAELGIRQGNFCGAQILPDVYKYFDTPDIAGLIAPRPLLVEMGIYDHGFFLQNSLKSFKQLEKIYTAAGSEDKLVSEVASNGHAFAGNKAFAFFKKYL